MDDVNGGAGGRRRRRRRRSVGRPYVADGRWWPGVRVSLPSLRFSGAGVAVFVLALLVSGLPLMMGHRTPATLTNTGLVLLVGAFLAVVVSGWQGSAKRRLPMPSAGWWVFFGILTVTVMLQVLPVRTLAAWFGPYPDALWNHPTFEPRTWSPHPAWTIRAWGVFVALFAIAWIAGSLKLRQRNWLYLAIAGMAVFQGLYGLTSHAAGSMTIFGIWERHGPDFAHGSFSNRNLFAGYLALTWPMVVAIWWIREMPVIARLPVEMRIAGSVICGAIIGAALMASASRLGSMAGLVGMAVALLLWTRYAGHLRGIAVWPVWLAAFAAFLFATWYGLAPLTERLAISTNEEIRLEVFRLIFTEFPPVWWLTGVGLGGFEAVFKQIQVGSMGGWWDYAHSDILQWVLEMGIVGVILLVLVVFSIVRNARMRRESIPLYAGLAALCIVALGDFSWHIPGTQVVLAIYIGVVSRPDKSVSSSNGNGRRRRQQPELPGDGFPRASDS